MGNLKRQYSRQDSQKSEHEDVKLTQTKVKMSDQTSTPDTVVEMNTLLEPEADRGIKLIQDESEDFSARRKNCSCLNLYLILLGITVSGLVVWNLRGVYNPTDPIERPDWQNSRLKVNNSPGFLGLVDGKETMLYSPRPEEYEIETGPLFKNKVVRWKGQRGSRHVISETSTNDGCILMKTTGTLKVFNTITFDYVEQKGLYHAIALCSGSRCDVVKKASFSWSDPQSGRQPSILQFLVRVETGNELCIQTPNTALIYAGIQDNVFLIEKITET